MTPAQDQDERRLRLDLKRRLRLAGFESDLAAVNDVTALRQLLVQQVTYWRGQPVEVECHDGWRPGTFNSFAAPLPDEDFSRLNVDLDGNAIGRSCTPECVRPAEDPKSAGLTPGALLDDDQFQEAMDNRASIGPFPVEPPWGSQEAVERAAETIRSAREEGYAEGLRDDVNSLVGVTLRELVDQVQDWKGRAARLTRDRNEVAADLEASRLLCGRLADMLQAIADLGGNLPDEKLTLPTGPNDAAARGLMYTEARRIAREGLRKAGRP